MKAICFFLRKKFHITKLIAEPHTYIRARRRVKAKKKKSLFEINFMEMISLSRTALRKQKTDEAMNVAGADLQGVREEVSGGFPWTKGFDTGVRGKGRGIVKNVC